MCKLRCSAESPNFIAFPIVKSGELGLGKSTLEQCLNYARDVIKINSVFLEVLADNAEALKVYENAGFQFLEQKIDGVKRYKKELNK